MNVLEIAVYALVLAARAMSFECVADPAGRGVACTNGLSAQSEGSRDIRFNNGVVVHKSEAGEVSFSNGIETYFDITGWVRFTNGISVIRNGPASFRFSTGYACRLVSQGRATCAPLE